MGTTETSRQVGEIAARGEDFHARAGYRRSRIARHLWKTTALTTLALGLSGLAAHADPNGLWQPQIRAIIGADNNGGNAALEGFIPLKQTAESVLFLDVRAKHDFKDGFGQDVGLGIRRIVNPDLMIGGYAYLNIENYNSTQFTAATLGAEAITPHFDAHVNVYLPIKGDSTDHSASSTLSMVSNQLIEQISVIDHRDYAAWGIEGEIGAQVPVALPDKHSLRLDIGGYHFEDPHGDDGSVTGAKAGFEYTIGDVFGSNTELVFAGEVRNDNRDDTQFAGSVRLNIPFNPGSGSDNADGTDSGAEPVYPVSEGLRKRVNERVRGDIGVRVQSQTLTGGTTTRIAINAATSAAFGKFYFADGGLAGAGTLADPTTLDDAVTKSGANGFVVALGGNGNLTTGGVTLANGQTVIGGGESVTARLFGGGTSTFNLGGSDGTIQGTNVVNPVITLGNGNTLNGITITGGANGILGNNITGATLTNVTVTGAGGNGADFTGSSTGITGSNFTATGNGLDGLHIDGDGTYNFTGTTLLQGNLDDGLDITGKGTYTFATVNAQDNTDRGITVQGTSTGGTFTTTGGTISGNGGTAVFIDPITAHVVLDSISQSGGTSGVVLENVAGSFTVNGATTISNTTGPAIAISDSPATIRFGDISITNPGADGISFAGVNAAVVAGNIVISGLGVGTGLDFSGSRTNFTAQSLNITGTGAAGSIGIDLTSPSVGGAVITITDGGVITNVDTGVRLGIAGTPGATANAEFTFGGDSSSISGITASLDARGLNEGSGHYAFGTTQFTGLQLYDLRNYIFVAAGASGGGTSITDLASIDYADSITASDAIIVLVNRGTIDDATGFSLSDGQELASFGNGREFSLGGVPLNVTGTNVHHDESISDSAGAATLTSSGGGDVVTLGNGNTLLDFNISGGAAAGIHGLGVNGLTVQGVTVSNVATGLFLDGVTGTVSVDDLTVQTASQTGIALVGSSATVNFTGNTKITNATSAALSTNNFDGIATFDDLDITGGGVGIGIVGGSSGTLTFGVGSSIANTSSNAFSISNSTPNVTYNGTINQTAATSAVTISGMSGGSATFGGAITASTATAFAINLSGNTGGTIKFTGGLDLTTTIGTGFSATGGGTITVAAAGTERITTGTGHAIYLDGVTIGTGGMAFDSITTGVVAATALNFNAVSGGQFLGGNVTIGGTGAGINGVAINASSSTFTITNLVTTNVAGTDVSLTNNTGSITILGGTITNSGVGDGVVISGGSATIGVAANIFSSATAPGTAVKVDGTTGGSVTFSGSITSTGTGNLFAIGSSLPPVGGAISFIGSTLSATGGGGAVVTGLAGTATLNVTAPLSITGATATGLAVANVASTASATFGAVTVSGATGNGIDITNNAGAVTFGTTSVTMGSTVGPAGINFALTNADVTFGTTNVTMGSGANQTGIDFSGSSTTADFGVTTITGTDDLTSRGIDLSSTIGNKTITFLQGSSISKVGVGVELSSGGTTATSANANFTFGDGNAGDGLESFISAAAGGYTVNTIGLDPTLGNYDFDDVAFTGNAHLASAVGAVVMISQGGGVIAAGTNGLSAAVTTVTAAQADAMTGTLTFAFVGTVDLSATPFTLDSGQSITGFGNGSSILTSGTIQPINVQGNLGATGGNVTGNEGVVKSTGGDTLQLLGSNHVRDTAFDFSGGSGSVFLVDQGTIVDNAGGIFIEGVTITNVAAGQTAFKVVGLDSNLSITDNNINVAGTLLDVDGGAGNITVTRGTLPNSGPAGTLTGGGISIANRSGGTVDFTDKVTVGGNGVSLTGNAGSTITFADVDITTNDVTAFSATGGGTVNVVTGTINATNAQAAALDGITAGINFASTSATFASGSGVDLQNLSGTASFGTGTLTNTGSGTSFNVGSGTAASGGNATISYGGTIASNGTGAAVSIQSMTGGSVTLSGNLTDTNAAAGGNIVVAGNDAAAITFSGTSKVISSGATDGVSLGIIGNYASAVPALNTNSTIDFTNGGLAITTMTGAGFVAIGDLGPAGATSTIITVTGAGNEINAGSDGLVVYGANVGSAGITFDSISADSTIPALPGDPGGAGVTLLGANLVGDVNIGGLRDTGYTGAWLYALSGTGEVNFTGTIDLDVQYAGFDIGGPEVGTVNIANVAGSTLTIDGGQFGIIQSSQGGTVNVGVNGSASITNTTVSAISLGGGNDLAFTTLTYKGSITVGAGSVISASGDATRLNMSGSVVSTTSSTAFDFFGHAEGIYDISSTIDHSGGEGVAIGGSANGTVTFSSTSKIFNTGANDAIVKAPSYVMDPQTKGTLNFTNGGLVITTSSGAGFTASTFGPGTISVTGDGNTITTGTGTALKLGDATAVVAGAKGATVGAGGIKFDTISVNGAATGISLNNVSGGTLNLGAVDLQGVTTTGVQVSGTLGSTLNFASLTIGLNAANAVGLDLNGAALGASNITADDFDVDGGGFAGTIGIDMAGTTGTGTIQLGDTVNNNPAGQKSTIANVGYGVQFSSATNARLVFGDGAGPAESSIATTGGHVIHTTDSLPTNGDYNFNDVNFTGDVSNLSSISVYYVTEGGTGDGSLANPGSYAGAQASTANVVVLIDKNVNGAQETIDLSGTTFNLDDGQVLLAFKSGDAAVDVSQLGVDTSSGASAAFHFTTVQNSPIISAPGGIDTLRPVLQSNNATQVINLATSGSGIFTGGIQNLIVSNLGSGAGVAANATGASSFFVRNNTIAAGGNALDFSTTGAPANTLLLSIDGNTLQSTGSGLAASFAGQNINATDNSIAIRSFAGNKVTGGAGSGGIAFNNVRFDSDGAGGTVSAGTLGIGNPGARVQGNGLSFTNTSGTLDLGTLSLANNGGTGVIANTKTTNFTLNNSGGVVTTNNGAAFDLDPLTVNMTFATVSALGGTNGIIFDGVAGTFTVTGGTSITNTTGFGIDAINTNTGTFNFNTVTVNNVTVPNTGGGIRVQTGTLNVTGLANIDTTSGVGLSQAGGTTSFTNGVTIDTTAGTGILATGGTMGITATAAAQTVNATGGTAINLSGVAATIALDSTSSAGGVNNVSLTNVSGALNLGTGALSGATGASFNVVGGTAAVSYSGTVNNSGAFSPALNVQSRLAGAGLVALSGNLTASGLGVSLNNNAGGTVTVSGASNSFTGGGTGISITANTGGTYNISGASYAIGMSGGGLGVDIAGNSAPVTVNFNGGGLAIVTSAGAGFNATGSGPVSVTGVGNSIATGTGVAMNLSGVTVAATGMNFSSTSNGAGGNSAVVLTNVIGSGTINLGAGSLVGGSAATIAVSGGTANLNYTGNVSQSNNATLVSVAGGHSGTLNFATGALSATNGTGLQFDNADGIYSFVGTTTLNGGNASVDILNGSGGTFNFGTGTSIISPSGTAFNVNGGTATVTYAGTITQATAGQRMIVVADTAGGSVNFTTAVANGLNDTGGTGIVIDGAAGSVTVNNASLTGTAGITILGDSLNNATGTYTFNNVAIQTDAGAANHAFVVDGDQGTPGNDDVSAVVNLNNVDITNPGGNVANIRGMAGGSVNFDSASTITRSDGGLGIAVLSNAGGTINFGGAVKTLSTGVNAAVILTSNPGATISFTNGGLIINTTSGGGFSATGGGTVTVQGTGNTITSGTGTALNVVNTTIGASGLNFQSISANGGTNGIVLNNTGSAGLTVTGVGTTAGSGGTIQNTTGRGASFISASNITLKNMNFTNAGTDDLDADNSGLSTGDNLATNAAIHLQNVSTATLDRIAISGGAEQGINGNTVSNFTLSNSSISNAGNGADEDGIHFYNMSGTSAVTSTTITGSGDDNFQLQTQSGTLALTISGGSSTGAVLGSGYLFGIRGTSNATINFSGANSSNNFSGGIVADAFDSSTMNLNVINSTSSSNNDQLSVSAGDNSDVSLVATGNTLSSTATGDFVVVSLLGSAFDNGFTFDARIENNTITVANGLTADGISVINAGGGAMRVGIKNNTIDYAGSQRAILVQTGQDGAGSILAQITGNAIDIKLDGAGNAVAGILVQSGITSPTGDGSSIDLNIGGAGALANTFTHSLGGTMAAGDIRVRQRNNGTINLSGYAGAPTDLAAAIAYLNSRNTVVSASTATADSTGFTGLATPPFP
ncbi:inverse autotransporter beta domain-containing protein [Mesorhizobium sp. M7A.F.Ca.US.010.02.1.1]|uniref:inverse autotransporter beta domain-containing protein n=1 Tax=Mesorhizobium sp. M7A.F.Ca.US.010.02.1.1 TaxID=2496743 RepID=UPI0019D4173E|nr:inverse autotransporter beta domain-containing protein [Mesorhizobium sp. M7A.F.Ca.US.010.02.1.1]